MTKEREKAVLDARTIAAILALGGTLAKAPPNPVRRVKSKAAAVAAGKKKAKWAVAEPCLCGEDSCQVSFPPTEKTGMIAKQRERFLERCRELGERHKVHIFAHTTTADYQAMMANAPSDEASELIGLTQALACLFFPWAAPQNGAARKVYFRGAVAHITLDGRAWYTVPLEEPSA